MSFNDPIDNYCERIGQGLLAEPLNLFSNLAFILAGLYFWKNYCLNSSHKNIPGVKILSFSIILIGLGSSTFHSFATYGAMLADVLPIAIFLLIYLFYFFRWQAGLNKTQTIMSMLGFCLLTLLLSKLADQHLSNGSELYFGAWMSLFGITCFMFGKSHFSKTRLAYLTAFASFSLSLLLRTIDLKVCESIHIGTHFGWHLLNALVIFLITREYLDHSRGSATLTRRV